MRNVARHPIAALHVAAATLLISAAPTPVAAQAVIVDEGSLALSRNGARIGREDFVIRRIRSSSGESMQLTSTISLGDRRLAPAMETDSLGAPVRFQLEEKRGGRLEEQLRAQFMGGRASIRSRSASGEATREAAVGDGTLLLLQDDGFAPYYFVARAAERGSSVVTLDPRRGGHITLRVENRGREPVSIGGQSINARVFALNDGSQSVRVWVDDQGRLLKVVDGHGTTAVREDPPR